MNRHPPKSTLFPYPTLFRSTNTVVTSADLSVTKTDGVTTVTAGDGVTRTYTITVSNTVGSSDGVRDRDGVGAGDRSEEHTSELQSRPHLVCRLLLDKKNKDT